MTVTVISVHATVLKTMGTSGSAPRTPVASQGSETRIPVVTTQANGIACPCCGMCWAPYTRTPPRTAPLYGYCPKGGTTTHSGHECANINVNRKHSRFKYGPAPGCPDLSAYARTQGNETRRGCSPRSKANGRGTEGPTSGNGAGRPRPPPCARARRAGPLQRVTTASRARGGVQQASLPHT